MSSVILKHPILCVLFTFVCKHMVHVIDIQNIEKIIKVEHFTVQWSKWNVKAMRSVWSFANFFRYSLIQFVDSVGIAYMVTIAQSANSLTDVQFAGKVLFNGCKKTVVHHIESGYLPWNRLEISTSILQIGFSCKQVQFIFGALAYWWN